MVFIVIWQFEVAAERAAEFEAAYGASGRWAHLFQRSPAWRGTELLKDAYVEGRYVTIDRWDSEAAYRDFRREFDADYEAIDRGFDALTEAETRIGAFVV